eukprot:scaffold3437_cov113-Cylindrotheca_fusiformis.AAC.1
MFQKRTNRMKRAQQLKQRRGGVAAIAQDSGSGNSSNGGSDGGIDLEIGPMCTLICAALIVALGAAVALILFMHNKPDCMKSLGLDRRSLLRSSSSSTSASNTSV